MEKKDISLEEYVNLERAFNLLILGPIEGIYNTKDLLEEYSRVQEKKSRLSRRNRERIVLIYEAGERRYRFDKEKNSTELFDKLYNSLQKMVSYVKGGMQTEN